MYWTNKGNRPSIMRASMDGTRHITLFFTEIYRPGPLTIDVEGNKLYWADSRLKRIECSDLSGGNRKTLVDTFVVKPRGMAIFGNFLYWINKKQHGIRRIDKTTGKNRSYIQGRLKHLRNLVFAKDLAPGYLNHPCAQNKGSCSHICMADSNGKAKCSCPLNMTLRLGDKTCEDRPSCSPEQFTCVRGEIHCIPMMWRCDEVEECADGSDEIDCPNLAVTHRRQDDKTREHRPTCSPEL
jgi:low density lipoprotein receptor-related protein 5/6